MTETTLTREQELVAYFVRHCGDDNHLGRTRLVKLLYLADYEARRFLGRPLSAFNYIWHHHGPYDAAIQHAAQVLLSSGVIAEDVVTYPNGTKGYLYHGGETASAPSFTPVEVEILSYVCREYSRRELRELLEDVVYQTEPMVDAQQRKANRRPLAMEAIDGAKREELGVPLEEIVERSRLAQSGDYLVHEEAMKRLDAELARA